MMNKGWMLLNRDEQAEFLYKYYGDNDEVIESVLPVLETLSIEQFAEVQATIYENPFIPHKPFGNQLKYLVLHTDEALYGGQAGGGKSDAMLMEALQWVGEETYAALLLRRTYKDLSLPGALMDRAHQWLKPTSAKWNEIEKTWTFPRGPTLSFGYLQYEKDKYNYQGAEFQYVGFDELTQFTESQYLYLFSRLRRLEGSPIPIRMRAASNPGGLGHQWVKQRFITEGELYGRPYIPSSYLNNPYIDRAKYEEALNKLDWITRRQLKHGDWEASISAGVFMREWFKLFVDAPPTNITRVVRYWDLGHTKPKKAGDDPDYTVGLLMALDVYNRIIILDVKRMRGTPLESQELVKRTALEDYQMYGDKYEIYMEQEPAAGADVIDHYSREVLFGYVFKGIRSTNSKEERAKPVSAYIEQGNAILVNGLWLNEFLNEIEAFPTEGIHDDQVDCLSGAFNQLVGPRQGAFLLDVGFI